MTDRPVMFVVIRVEGLEPDLAENLAQQAWERVKADGCVCTPTIYIEGRYADGDYQVRAAHQPGHGCPAQAPHDAAPAR